MSGDPRAAAVAAVDWGTSRFRLYLLDGDGETLAERRSEDGLDAARAKGFAATLESELAVLGAAPDLPVAICGMAGSRQGWHEAPYVTVPARPAAILAGAAAVPDLSRPVRIIPGLAQRGPNPDVMRGEETKLLGLVGRDPGLTATVVMPGTHCKWVGLRDGAVEHFSTCPTGELFALLGGHSILRHSIGDAADSVDGAAPAFKKGVEATLEAPVSLLGRLFPIRAATLLDDLPPADAAARLSGLLIGAEIAGALAGSPAPETLMLVAAGRLASLYGAAFEIAGLAFTATDADEASRRGLHAAATALWPERFEADA